MHVSNLRIITVQFSEDHLFVLAIGKLFFDFVEVANYFGQLIRVCFLRLRLLYQLRGLFVQLVNFGRKCVQHWFQITLSQLVLIHNVVVPMFANRTSETDPTVAIFAESAYGFVSVFDAP